jgi:hypothetical protein
MCFCHISKYVISVTGYEADFMHNLGRATYSLHCAFNCCTQAPAHEHVYTHTYTQTFQ